MSDFLDSLVEITLVEEMDSSAVAHNFSANTDTSVLYKTALADQTWSRSPGAAESNDRPDNSSDNSEYSPPVRPKNEAAKEDSILCLQGALNESHAALPPTRGTQSTVLSVDAPAVFPLVVVQSSVGARAGETSNDDAASNSTKQGPSRKRKSSDGQMVRRQIMPPGKRVALDAGDVTRNRVSIAGNPLEQFELAVYNYFFGIKVQDPKIAPATFLAYIGERQKIRISEVTAETAVNWNDWVTMGVLVDKTPVKESSKGSHFSIWKLSDLINCQRVIRVLLFGECALHFWGLKNGDVVALMNAAKMEDKTNGATDAKKQDSTAITVKVDKKQQIVAIGSCPDYGTCSGIKHLDNRRCSNFVNKSKNRFCEYHVVAAAKPLAARRGALQLASNVPPKRFNNTMKNVLAARKSRYSRVPIKKAVTTTENGNAGPSTSRAGARSHLPLPPTRNSSNATAQAFLIQRRATANASKPGTSGIGK